MLVRGVKAIGASADRADPFAKSLTNARADEVGMAGIGVHIPRGLCPRAGHAFAGAALAGDVGIALSAFGGAG